MATDTPRASGRRRCPTPPAALPVRDGKGALPSLGCEKCRHLDNDRRAARNRGDHSAAADCSARIRRHPHH